MKSSSQCFKCKLKKIFKTPCKEHQISDEAFLYVKKNKKLIYKEYADIGIYRPEEKAPAYFMAGAPGSGKTEIVRSAFEEIFDTHVIVDADEIRKKIPGYTGKNAYLFQRAASKGVDFLFDYAIKKDLPILIDGTFSYDYEKCRENISRCINKNRPVVIFYIYTNPRLAWRYAKMREYTEGRKISIRIFVKAFFECRYNINRIKEDFGDRVSLMGIWSNYKKGFVSVKADILSVDDIKEIRYNRSSLYLGIWRANISLHKQLLVWKLQKLLKKL